MEQWKEDKLGDAGVMIDGEVRRHFATGAKWAKFNSIVVLIACGLFLLLAIAGSSFLVNTFGNIRGFGALAEMGGGIVLFLLILIIALVGLIYYFLLNFSSKIRQALISGNAETMNAGIASLKVYFIILGVFGILSVLITLFSFFQTLKF